MENEIKILKDFIEEFSPFYNRNILNTMNHEELINVIKNIVKDF